MVRMKLSKSTANVLTAIILVFSLFNCSDNSDPLDDCSNTKFSQEEQRAVQAYMPEPEEYCDSEHKYWSDSSAYILCTGTVQKFYCGGTPSGLFEFDDTYYPDLNATGRIPLGQLYQFKFDNTFDIIKIRVELKAHFSDGKIFKTGIFPLDYYFPDIKYDYVNGKYYVNLVTGSYTWTPAN